MERGITNPLNPWIRNATVQAVAYLENKTIDVVATKLYGHEGAASVLKAAVQPASTDGWGGQLAAAVRVTEFLRSLAPKSAAAQLIQRGLRVSLDRIGSASLPGLSSAFPPPAWVLEGAPIPAYKGSFGNATLTPKKLAAIGGLTGELFELSAEDAEAVIEAVMIDAAAKALDTSVFSDAAASSTRPAGILNGVAALTPTSGGGLEAFLADLQALVGAIHEAGGGSDVVLIASPKQAVTAKILGGPGLDMPVLTAPHLAAGTVIAVEAQAFASGFGDVPRVEVGKQALIDWEDTPAQIGTAGTPNVVAAPARSGFQTNLHALRLILRAAWALRAPMVAWVEDTTW